METWAKSQKRHFNPPQRDRSDSITQSDPIANLQNTKIPIGSLRAMLSVKSCFMETWAKSQKRHFNPPRREKQLSDRRNTEQKTKNKKQQSQHHKILQVDFIAAEY